MQSFALDGATPKTRAAPAALARPHGGFMNLQRMMGNQAVQRLLQPGAGTAAPTPMQIHASAQQGLRGSAAPLPHADAIQRSFGRYAVHDVRAFVGGPAGDATRQIGASAYSTGGNVAFSQPPDLRTAAHEAAHVVQQRAGVDLRDGVGQRGDRYERHAERVADAVVGGRSAEPLLHPYGSAAPARSPGVQFQDGPPAVPTKEQICRDLRAALENSKQMIDLYRQFLAGTVTWETVESKKKVIGNAAQGVVGEGKKLPLVVQAAVAEVEKFGMEEVSQMGSLIWSGVGLAGAQRFNVARANIEIDRQSHYNLVLIRKLYENECPDVPGTWAAYQQQVLTVGTRGQDAPRSTIETPRATKTALAWVSIGSEQVLVLATEVAGAGVLRFDRWIDREFKDLSLAQAASTQGPVPSVPAAAVTGLPSPVPGTAARR
jgi:hypothetical protein